MKARILVVYNAPYPFVRKDIEILGRVGTVRELGGLRYLPGGPIRLARDLLWADLIFCWFAGRHAVLPVLLGKLLGKRAVIVAGGWDVASEPAINYGLMQGGSTTWLIRFLLKIADRVSVISENNKQEAIQNARLPEQKIELIYPGFHPIASLPVQKEPLVLTVGRVSWEYLTRKGLETFVRSAAHLPEVPFILIGEWFDDAIECLRSIAPPNVHFTGFVSEDELSQYMARASVYVQVSHHEQFGCSLAEAMLHECIPVVTRRAAIPEVVGDCGIYVESTDPGDVARAISQALDAPASLGQQARERIEILYPLERREQALIKLVTELLSVQADTAQEPTSVRA